MWKKNKKNVTRRLSGYLSEEKAKLTPSTKPSVYAIIHTRPFSSRWVC